MATGGNLALPEPLEGEDAKSWFKCYEVCGMANGWNDQKKLLRLPTLLTGHAWAVYNSLHEDGDTNMYEHLKATILQHLCPDTEEDRLVAQRSCLGDAYQRVKVLINWPIMLRNCGIRHPPDYQELCESELRFTLINALPEKVSFQLKLQLKRSYVETIARGKELHLTYSRAETQEHVNQVQTNGYRG